MVKVKVFVWIKAPWFEENSLGYERHLKNKEF